MKGTKVKIKIPEGRVISHIEFYANLSCAKCRQILTSKPIDETGQIQDLTGHLFVDECRNKCFSQHPYFRDRTFEGPIVSYGSTLSLDYKNINISLAKYFSELKNKDNQEDINLLNEITANELMIMTGVERRWAVSCEKCGSYITDVPEDVEIDVNWDLYHCETNGCTVPVEEGVKCSGADWKSYITVGPYFVRWHFKCHFCGERWNLYGAPLELPVIPEGDLHGICPNKCHLKKGS